MKNRYLETGKRNYCYGCGMCVRICPVKAITVALNEQGFMYPMVDSEKCVDCGRCDTICPNKSMEKYPTTVIYQVAHKNIDVLQKSQCGGAFTAISDYFLNGEGVVYGAAIMQDMKVAHIRATTMHERDLMRGSKYVQSNITQDLLNILENDIKAGRKVLFTGTPCQCAMVYKNFGHYSNVFICDFICHGVPSPLVWEKYLKWIEHKYNTTIFKVIFRNKRCRGIGNFTESYYTNNSTEIVSNDYAALFYSHLAHRESCFECQFATKRRCSDMTIGGFLEPSDFEAQYDSSMILVNTEKGSELFDRIKGDMDYRISNLKFYKNQPCLYHPVPKPKEYEEFWRDWQNKDMEFIVNKYSTEKIKKIFHIEIIKEEKY